jgi:hypothetical protein
MSGPSETGIRALESVDSEHTTRVGELPSYHSLEIVGSEGDERVVVTD